MEPFSINLSEMTHKKSRYKRLLIVLALLFFISSIAAFFLFFHETGPSGWVLLIWGLYFLVYIYFGYVGYSREMFVNVDDFALEYQFSFFRKVPDRILWETVNKVKLGFTYIAFHKKTGRKKIMNLGWLPYSKLKEIKNKVNGFCLEKGIEVETAEYHKEEEFESN